MPQMAPMNWLLLLLFFIVNTIIMMMINYYMTQPLNLINSIQSPLKVNSTTWKW